MLAPVTSIIMSLAQPLLAAPPPSRQMATIDISSTADVPAVPCRSFPYNANPRERSLCLEVVSFAPAFGSMRLRIDEMSKITYKV